MGQRFTRLRKALAATAIAGLLGAATACGSTGQGAQADGVVDYWLWDSAQQPGYQQCADAFQQENPDVRVRITQYGWDDYWQKVTAGFIADTAPDVFTNHLARFAQYADLGVLLPLDQLEATQGIADEDYQEGLAELWKGQDGHRYGAPKDWDTVAIFYNRAMTQEAGISDEQLATMEWNPTDGGTFEQIVARLTVDANGVRGDEPGFNKNRIRTYGFNIDEAGGGNYGQTQWSPFTASNGWHATDVNPWANRFNFDDPKFQDALAWYFSLAQKGYAPDFAASSDSDRLMAANQAAMAINGSWMIGTFTSLETAAGERMDIKVAPTPIGPTGHRASMFNGLADSIWVGTPEPEKAARWVAYLAGAECQDIIGRAGVVFPARPSGTQLATEYNRTQRQLDVTPFTVHVTDGTTFQAPVVNYAADIQALIRPALDAIYMGREPVSSMTAVNEQVNALLEQQPEG
ncbi:multiple sugar transport system substrate-binding protein [Kineosphaera limosa]|uniref:Putative ABC transporter substrate-binding protein n=1 Tax=Kineosphaera limosa NBRC 100340 TaxID=1184609 RepID=K6WRY0_9MICO|nr:sugar ABC transporter substrate-binding protein [Kineosphaera limosa]NYD98854.1 multiple sugar transport system substrate-binding protein [Kineosphaera limosa]GAB94822.1 putative ABC transporter substrate-binding protein [Kineosphaera limosa NBRC 100340]